MVVLVWRHRFSALSPARGREHRGAYVLDAVGAVPKRAHEIGHTSVVTRMFIFFRSLSFFSIDYYFYMDGRCIP